MTTTSLKNSSIHQFLSFYLSGKVLSGLLKSEDLSERNFREVSPYIWRLVRPSGGWSDPLEAGQTLWRLVRLSGGWSDSLEAGQTL